MLIKLQWFPLWPTQTCSTQSEVSHSDFNDHWIASPTLNILWWNYTMFTHFWELSLYVMFNKSSLFLHIAASFRNDFQIVIELTQEGSYHHECVKLLSPKTDYGRYDSELKGLIRKLWSSSSSLDLSVSLCLGEGLCWVFIAMCRLFIVACDSLVAFSLLCVSLVAPWMWYLASLIRDQICIPALEGGFSASGPPGKAP